MLIDSIMYKIDGFYLYRVGYLVHPLIELKGGDDYSKWEFQLYSSMLTITTLYQQSVYNFKSSKVASEKLLNVLRGIIKDKPNPITVNHEFVIKSALTEFENVLSAEFGVMDVYLIRQKRGYNTNDLIDNGMILFPPDLSDKVPEAVSDIRAATKCIAFVLPTAAGFHLHRANEAVLHRYFDEVTNKMPRPNGRNIGDYLRILDDGNIGEKRIRSALRDLKDLHRNPLVHPEHSLDSIDEAISLLNSIQSVMVHMLRAIPDQQTNNTQDVAP